ncbi:Protein kinase-like domain superfamily [Arabidopsis suecica]|uniref:non-specific serine/threonine protein kinase n=1 Tax=Arabidopsis suecica TaxID=45249 RepID=A0A8T2H1G7_ARASU|nr:Protein kinase-like domain superfamily [Arabidopsis suecica]
MGKSGDGVLEEIIHITRSNVLEICLVKTGTSTPIISSIELRPFLYDTYTAQTGSLRSYNRFYFTDSNNYIRYPQDVHDRIWIPLLLPEWTHINTTHHVIDSIDGYDPPQDVLRTGAMPANASDPMTFTWNLETATDQVYGYIYTAEITDVPANETREFEVVANDKVHFDPFSPTKFEAQILFNDVPLTCEGGFCRVRLIKTPRSTLPPLMNAFEIFTVIEFPQSETNQNDVIALKKIQATYGLNRISWQGDPCVPKQFSWTGLSCNVIDLSTPPRIVKLDLSSSGLNGVISPSIQNLTQLQELDLSQNNLTGEVPEFLAKMKSLLVINLSGNKLSGLVPQALLDRKKEGLKLLRRKPSAGKVRRSSFKSKNRRFTYSDVKEMTNNFQVVLGKGGFGVVYQGCLNNEQAAVKVLSPSSAQGYKEFKTEVELLLRVHHEKLVSLIGYCDDENGLALIYELMGKGNLKEHLSGNPGGSVLSWPIRLKIALESAIGIEYLHTGCKPKIVHRDVKSTNILLSEEFDAKIADFGLSRSFIIGNEAESTVVAGTFGYLDPEYHKTSLLSTKSDVYSFGVVLLEIISGQPVIDLSRENCNIVEWTRSILEKGDIESIVDPNLHQDYDTSSAWKVLELAMSCVNLSSKERPNMSQVVHELNECLDTCEKWRNQRSQQEVDLRSPLELSITVDTEINPKAR